MELHTTYRWNVKKIMIKAGLECSFMAQKTIKKWWQIKSIKDVLAVKIWLLANLVHLFLQNNRIYPHKIYY